MKKRLALNPFLFREAFTTESPTQKGSHVHELATRPNRPGSPPIPRRARSLTDDSDADDDSPAVLLAFFVLLVISSPPLASALQFTQWGSLLSLSHSLLTRVADSRAARGDLAAAERARKIAGNLRLLSVGGLWSLGWDFVRNYAWRGGGGFPTAEIALAAGRLLAVLDEARRAGSAEEMARWAIRRSPELVARADSLMRSLLRVFSQSGPLRDMMLVIKEEVAEGGLLKIAWRLAQETSKGCFG